MEAAPTRRRSRRRALWVLAGVLLVLVVARLALDPIAAWRTRKALANLEGYRATFSDLSLSLLHLSYSVHDLRLVPTARSTRPAFRTASIEVAIDVGALARLRRLVLRVLLDRPKLDVRVGGGGSKVNDADVRRELARLAPLQVWRIEVKRAEVAFTDLSTALEPVLRLRDLDVVVENLPTRPYLSRGEPTTLAASGTVQRTGQLSVFVTADPLARRLSFAGRSAVEGLALVELADLLARKADVLPSSGTIDLYARFQAIEGHLTGGVKPLLKGVQVRPARPGKPALKAWLTDAALKILSDRVPGRDAATGIVPIRGDLTSPKAELWTTVWAVLRNAFVAGIESGFTELPPGRARGAVPQARAPPRRGAAR